MDFELDDDKDAINKDKHGLPLDMAMQLFARDYIEEQDARFDYEETRFVATSPVAALSDRICIVVYTWRGMNRRLISFRRANDKEIVKYRQSHP